MPINPQDIRSLLPEELAELAASFGWPAYRADQLFTWLHRRGAASYDEMTDLPKNIRASLAAQYPLTPFEMRNEAVSAKGDAIKYLFALEKHTIIECVFMRRERGTALCVSVQAGCRMGCHFCASGADGLERDLTAGEMCAQVYAAARRQRTRIDRVVMMGCGEPLDNYRASVRFISLISHPKGLNIGQRHITLSTCGLVPRIDDLSELGLPITLAVSLHAPDDGIRAALMPVARRYPLRELLDACWRYTARTRRRITFEYALIAGVNDSDAFAGMLCGLLRGRLCHVNIIPMNETFPPYAQSRRAAAFTRILAERRIPATVRLSLGADVGAACGQLRGKHASGYHRR